MRENKQYACKLTNCPVLRLGSVGTLLVWVKTWMRRVEAMWDLLELVEDSSAIASRQCWGKT